MVSFKFAVLYVRGQHWTTLYYFYKARDFQVGIKYLGPKLPLGLRFMGLTSYSPTLIYGAQLKYIRILCLALWGVASTIDGPHGHLLRSVDLHRLISWPVSWQNEYKKDNKDKNISAILDHSICISNI